MPAAKPPTPEQLALATEMRVAGATWEAIAQELGFSASAVRRWEKRFGKRWWQLTAFAERRLMAQATGEAVTALRQQLRSENEKTSREAAQRLIQLRIVMERGRVARKHKKKPKRPKTLNGESRRIAHHLEALSDGQIDALLREVDEEAGAPRAESPLGDD
jgi:predicted transcriptional regulator